MPTYAALFMHPAKGKENVDAIPTEVFPRAHEFSALYLHLIIILSTPDFFPTVWLKIPGPD